MWDMGVMIFNGDTEGQGALLLRGKGRRDVFLKGNMWQKWRIKLCLNENPTANNLVSAMTSRISRGIEKVGEG